MTTRTAATIPAPPPQHPRRHHAATWQVLTIGAGVAILGDEMSTRKGLGLLLCLFGIGFYHRITTAVRATTTARRARMHAACIARLLAPAK